jgi:predicted metal-binding membrane protein
VIFCPTRATPTLFESLLKRDRRIAIGTLIAVSALAWTYTIAGAGLGMSALEMTSMSGTAFENGTTPGMVGLTTPAAWTPGYALLMLVMWWAMMVAMMLPSAAPMILLFALVNRQSRAKGGPFVPTAVFVGAYLIAWGVFSAVAVTLQWGLDRAELLSPMMASRNVVFGGTLLILAGVYQLSPVKQACLRHCRGPMAFISRHWRAGNWGAFRMGVHHGVYCLGCCWALMMLLFFGGIMNLYWIAGLALFVLLEKTVPAGHWLARLSGLGLVGWGAALLMAN